MQSACHIDFSDDVEPSVASGRRLWISSDMRWECVSRRTY